MQPGLWAVEPLVARGDTGSKFEEMLVVTDDDAFYLDDDLSHQRRWRGPSASLAESWRTPGQNVGGSEDASGADGTLVPGERPAISSKTLWTSRRNPG